MITIYFDLHIIIIIVIEFGALAVVDADVDKELCVKQLGPDSHLCLETTRINWAARWELLGHLEPPLLTVELTV